MAGKVTIYHNPRCSKSRQTLDLIRGHGVEPEIVEYLKETPTADELCGILKKLKLGPRDIMRTGEAVYKELGLGDPVLSDDALLAAMAANPILIERPIVVKGAHAALGRPPEAVLSLL
jgi:arsenate reductase (glutaredoxin)